jgi:tetratricopeptide (TPR) repeat protein
VQENEAADCTTTGSYVIKTKKIVRLLRKNDIIAADISGGCMFSSTGEIKNMTIAWLFQDIHRARKTGTAVLEREAGSIKVFFRQGDVIFASSQVDEDAMAESLLHAEKITRAQLDKSRKITAKSGKRLGAVLFEMGILAPQDLVAQAKFQATQNILSLFIWREGRYRFEENVLPGAEIVPFQMSAADLIIQGVRSLDWPAIRTALPPLNTIVRKVVDPLPLFQSAHLEQNELKVIPLITGNDSIQDICGRSNLGDLKTLSSIYILLALRMVETGGIKDQEEKALLFQVEREAFSAKASTASAPTAAGEALVNRELLQNAYDSLAMQNYYEILGVGHSATPQEIKKAYFGLARLYHPDRYAGTQLADMKQKLEALFKSINEAYQVLRDKAKRDQYNLDLASGTKQYGQEEQQPVVDKQEIDKASAAAKFNEGMKQLRVRNYWGAEEVFRGAVRLDPSKAEYVFHLGLALLHLPRRGHEAEEYFIKAIKLASSHVEYYLELGNFYMKNGNKTKALPVFQAALKRDPESEQIKQAVKATGG